MSTRVRCIPFLHAETPNTTNTMKTLKGKFAEKQSRKRLRRKAQGRVGRRNGPDALSFSELQNARIIAGQF